MQPRSILPVLPFALACSWLGCGEPPPGRPHALTPFDPEAGSEESETSASSPSPDLGDDDPDPPGPSPDLPDAQPEPAPHACYPGPARDWSVCLPLVYLDDLPDGYAYPDPEPGMWNYRTPIAYLDLEALDPDTMLAPDFRLGEIARKWKGRYAVVQPHAVERLQDLRDELGALKVDSGYRPPDYNAMIGGAEYSRHMYGDAFDLEPLDAMPSEVEDLCVAHDGHLFEYDTHVHCDWRDEPLDESFFGGGE